jgi:hypothetical protein
MARHSGEHEIHLLLNSQLTNTIEPIQLAFKDLLPDSAMHICALNYPHKL